MRVMPLPPRAGRAAEGLLCALQRGNQRPVELLQLIRTIELCLGRSAAIRLLPMQPGDVYETQARVDKLKAVTVRREPSRTAYERFVEWYLGEYLPLGLAEQTAVTPMCPCRAYRGQQRNLSVTSRGRGLKTKLTKKKKKKKKKKK